MMSLARAHRRRRDGEQGAALPMALAFLILFVALSMVILEFASSSFIVGVQTEQQRDDLAAVTGGVDAAIANARPNAEIGKDQGQPCSLSDVPVEGRTVTVTCTPEPGSGTPIPVTAAPPFAMLTLAPFTEYWDDHGYDGGNTYPGCSSISTAPGAELGIIETQDSKFVAIQGDVMVNSDVDADVWGPPNRPAGCPDVFGAQAIQVRGNLIVKEGCHDAYATLGWYCDANGETDQQTQQDAGGRTPNGAWDDAPAAMQANLQDPAIAQPNSWSLPFTSPPPERSVPACPAAGNVVRFQPGTYRDAAALSTLMNGTTCPGRVFYFPEGQYYFDFTNGGSHEWTINDGAARIVGGQATSVSTGGVLVGPVTWMPANASSSTWTAPANARAIDGNPATVQLGNITSGPTTHVPSAASSTTLTPADNALILDDSQATATLDNVTPVSNQNWTAQTLTNGQPGGNPGFNTNTANGRVIDGSTAQTSSFASGTRSATLSNFTGTGSPVPANAINVTTSVQVAHREGDSGGELNLVNAPTIQINPGSGPGCTLPVTKSGTSTVTQTIAAPCLNTPAAVNGATAAYSVAHSATAGSADARLDGIRFVVSYTQPGITSASETLTFAPVAPVIPAGANVTAATIRVRHAEGVTSQTSTPTVQVSGCGGNIAGVTEGAGLHTDTLTATSCLTAARLNGGFTVTYSVARCTGTSGGCTTAPVNVGLDGIDVSYTYSRSGQGSPATINLTGYSSNPASQVPNGATITSARVRVAHEEENPALVNNPQLTITPTGSPACAPIPVAKRATLGEDGTPSYNATNCLDIPGKINGGFQIAYTVSHCTGNQGGCVATQGTNVSLDGIWVDITYRTPDRSVWDPNDPNADPDLPGACRKNEDPLWTDGVQWVFGGDSNMHFLDGQMELCQKPQPLQADPSQNKQQIVLWGVKALPSGTSTWNAATTAPNTNNPCPTQVPAAPAVATDFCVSNNARTIEAPAGNAPTATARFATATTTSRAVTLSGGTVTPTIPAGANIASITARVSHRETSTTINSRQLALSVGGGPACPAGATVPANTTANLRIDTVDVTSCFGADPLAALSSGFTAAYTANYTCAGGSCPARNNPAQAILDGIDLQINWTAPNTGGLTPQRGCITQAPYYSPVDHSPAYDPDAAGPAPASCALIRVSRPAAPVANPCSAGSPDCRKITLWGTVYAPSAAFDLPVDLMPEPVFNRAVVARMVMLGYQVANSTLVPFTTSPLAGGTPQNRIVLVDSTLPGKTTTVHARVEFCDLGCPGVAPPGAGEPPGVVVHEWKVTR